MTGESERSSSTGSLSKSLHWSRLGQNRAKSLGLSICACHMGGRDPSIWALTCYFSKHISREQGQLNSRDLNKCSDVECRQELDSLLHDARPLGGASACTHWLLWLWMTRGQKVFKPQEGSLQGWHSAQEVGSRLVPSLVLRPDTI